MLRQAYVTSSPPGEHALATLATTCGNNADYTDAHKRLLSAVDGLAHTDRTRAKVLCQLQLARLHHRNGDRDEGARWAQAAAENAATVRSGRIARELALDLRGDIACDASETSQPSMKTGCGLLNADGGVPLLARELGQRVRTMWRRRS